MAMIITAQEATEPYIVFCCHMPTKLQTSKIYKDCISEVVEIWRDFKEGCNSVTTIVAGDMSVEMCADEPDERVRALKEMLATMGMEQHLDVAPLKKTWTLRGLKGQRRCYDYLRRVVHIPPHPRRAPAADAGDGHQARLRDLSALSAHGGSEVFLCWYFRKLSRQWSPDAQWSRISTKGRSCRHETAVVLPGPPGPCCP